MGDVATGLATHASIEATTSLGAVSLTVSDLGRARAFYEQVLGLVPSTAIRDDGALALTDAGGGPALVVLHEDRDAAPFDPRRSGLFHLAILVPSRIELARSLRRIADVRWPLTGASDHLVSEALYLRDPDGNGIEIYRDRPRAQWPVDDRGAIRMDTLRLDLSELLHELDDDPELDPASAVMAGTRIGHVHLQVSELDAAERLYCAVLGFDVTVRDVPGRVVCLSRWLPPPHRPEHLADPGCPTRVPRRRRAALVRGAAAGRRRAHEDAGSRRRRRNRGPATGR